MLVLRNPNGSGTFAINLNGLTITATGGVWNGRIFAPVPTNREVNIGDSEYAQTGSVYEMGNPEVSLVFSGTFATVTLPVPAELNGKTLRVYRSEDTVHFENITTCVVISSQCAFKTDRFSQFAFGSPTVPDTSPDDFVFATKEKAPTASWIESDAVTVLGINTPTPISASGGTYSVNGTVHTGSTLRYVSEGDVIRARVFSSESYGSTRTMELNVGGMKRAFSVTTLVPSAAGSSLG